MRLIDADKAINGVTSLLEFEWGYEGLREDIKRIFNSVHTVDAVEVVRCKDCKWFADNNNSQWFGCWLYNAIIANTENEKPTAEDFCSYGERKEE